MSIRKEYDIEYFQNFAREKGGECISASYTNCRNKLLFRCNDGHEWLAQPRKINEGRWCPECHVIRSRTYSIDLDFFLKDTPESFYVAGFISADGWVRSTYHGYVLGIELSIKDIKHLRNINTAMFSNYKIKTFIKSNESLRSFSPNVRDFSEICSLRIYNREIVKFLGRFGIVQAKTYDIELPDWMKSHPLVNHFMRGYIDGDGCFSIGNNKNQMPHVTFSMRGTVSILNSFHKVFIKNNVVKQVPTRKDLVPRDGVKKAVFDTLRYSGNGTISKIHDFLYQDSTICLERKRIIAAKAKEWAVYGTDKKKKPKSTNLFTKKELLEMAAELKDRKKVVEHFKCTSANISWWLKELEIKDEFNSALGKKTNQEILDIYNEIGTYSGTAKIVGLSRQRVAQICKSS